MSSKQNVIAEVLQLNESERLEVADDRPVAADEGKHAGYGAYLAGARGAGWASAPAAPALRKELPTNGCTGSCGT